MAKIDMFEHLKDPVDNMKLEATFRLWQALPFFSSIITNHLVELLKEKNAWRQSLKQDINNAIKCLKPQSEKFINRLLSQEEEDFHPLNFEEAICEKFVASFLEYYENLIRIGDIAETNDEEVKTEKFVKNLVGKAQFIITLKKGDVFTFIDGGKYEEYTYNGYFTKHNGEVVCDYISNNSSDGPELFHCENFWRPVIKVNIN